MPAISMPIKRLSSRLGSSAGTGSITAQVLDARKPRKVGGDL